ncbi:MAG: glycoside hydrolase family 38 C-terminal domain-containing protein [Candidatus Aminicenantales bacterium]
MLRQKIHLVCNAHLDPVWLWDWEEGAGEALSTFRSAASLCEEFPEFVFNHNEAILYRWVEEYEPSLFKRIRRLVKNKRWHILGGWHLQPDCNMPCGESLVRQILLGKRYFREKFGVDIRTASNLDPFGHSRGLVQILAKSGYDSYIFCRPGLTDGSLPAEDFVWVGFNGSEIMASLVAAHYNSPGGEAKKKVLQWMAAHPGRRLSLVLWGVGDHGGGAYRADLSELRALMKEHPSHEILHSHPEAYFKDLKKRRSTLPKHAQDINPWAVGCYTTMARIKQKHRLLENDLFLAEKMAAASSFQGLMRYPQRELREAQLDLAFSQFHDILPGSSIQPAEESSIRRMDHGLEILSRIKARAFFTLADGETPPGEGEIPIFAYNPHPFRVRGIFDCEFQPYEINRSSRYLFPQIYSGRKPLPSQPEKEASNLNIEWRKKVVFAAVLEPGRMNRFICRLEKRPGRLSPQIKEADGKIVFRTREIEVVINAETGLIDAYRIRGRDFLAANAIMPLVMSDNADPWGMTVRQFRETAGRVELAAAREAGEVSGISSPPPAPVRIVEDGPVRTVVEAVLTFGRSVIFQRYKVPRKGTEIEVELRVHWNEKDRMLKLRIPTLFPQSRYIGQTAYGIADLPADGSEAVAQKWVAVVPDGDDAALTVINDGVYGSDFLEGELRLSLLRSAAYAADPVPSGPIVAQDRYVPRIDQGERMFRFWINGGKRSSRLTAVDREALVRNEKPPLLAFFPAGGGKRPQPFIVLGDPAVEVAAVKKAEDGNDLIIRLFEPTGKNRETTLSLPWVGAKKTIRLRAFEIKTLAFNPRSGRFRELDLLERPLTGRR